jgi:hypothetical protein
MTPVLTRQAPGHMDGLDYRHLQESPQLLGAEACYVKWHNKIAPKVPNKTGQGIALVGKANISAVP